MVMPPAWAANPDSASTLRSQALAFSGTSEGGFRFDTGVLRGRLHADGKSLGLTEVIHVPSGKRLDRSMGLFSHYRVFANGKRYGGGAWDWPSQAQLRDDGCVEVRWPATAQRPFQMRALYRWKAGDTLELETTVTAEEVLSGFESFLAGYFTEGFTNAAVYASPSPETGSQPAFLRLSSAGGAWQMFPRNDRIVPLIKDGRWRLEPNPVDWIIRPSFQEPLAYRRNPATGLTALFMAAPSACFAVAAPHEAEGHYSMYFSLFGQDLQPGQTATARTRLSIIAAGSDEQALKAYAEFEQSLR